MLGLKKYSITRRDCNKLVFAIFLRLSPAAIELKHDFIVIKTETGKTLGKILISEKEEECFVFWTC